MPFLTFSHHNNFTLPLPLPLLPLTPASTPVFFILVCSYLLPRNLQSESHVDVSLEKLQSNRLFPRFHPRIPEHPGSPGLDDGLLSWYGSPTGAFNRAVILSEADLIVYRRVLDPFDS